MENPIYTYNRPKARYRIEIYVDTKMDPDGWFMDIQYIEKKTGKIAHAHCVIKKDLDSWIRSLESEGWILENKQNI